MSDFCPVSHSAVAVSSIWIMLVISLTTPRNPWVAVVCQFEYFPVTPPNLVIYILFCSTVHCAIVHVLGTLTDTNTRILYFAVPLRMKELLDTTVMMGTKIAKTRTDNMLMLFLAIYRPFYLSVHSCTGYKTLCWCVSPDLSRGTWTIERGDIHRQTIKDVTPALE